MDIRTVILRWAPRALAMAFTAFISLFALDAFEGLQDAREKAVSLMMHLLPTFICIAGIALAWRREWLGSVVFGLLFVGYCVQSWARPDWILVIGGPLVLLAVLYALAWRARRTLTARR